MSDPTTKAELEQQVLALQEELSLLRRENTDLKERDKAYSKINIGQASLINKLIDKVPFGVMLVNEEHFITHVNEEAENIFSISSSKLVGQNCEELFAKSNISPTNRSEKEVTQLDNGKYVVHSAFISDVGSHKVIVKSFIDVSDIKTAEQELIKINKTKDEFLSMISHELRTPLNVIQGYSSLLEDEVRNIESTEAVSYLEQINRAGGRLLHVVACLLELSDLTAGKVKVDPIPLDLSMVISQLQYRLEKDFADEGNKLKFTFEDISFFEHDLALLMKVLYELLINANKFTEDGEVTLSIFIQNKEQKEWICFKVLDTGCGMTTDTIKHIFNAFHQADSTLSRAHEGLGLGLSLVEKIVKLIDGVIEVESEIGVGSSFVVWLPYKAVKNL